MILYCEECSIKVADIKKGSLLKSGMACLCQKCEAKRKDFDIDRLKSKFISNPFKNINGFENFNF